MCLNVVMQEPRTNATTTGIRAKVENKAQYDQYLEELEPMRKELGVELKENLYPELRDR